MTPKRNMMEDGELPADFLAHYPIAGNKPSLPSQAVHEQPFIRRAPGKVYRGPAYDWEFAERSGCLIGIIILVATFCSLMLCGWVS